MTQNDARAPEARPDPDTAALRPQAIHRYLNDPEFHARVQQAYQLALHQPGIRWTDDDRDAVKTGAIMATFLAEQAEVQCPECGTHIRARMADADSTRNALLASVLRKLITDGRDIGNNVDLGYRHYMENGRLRENPQLPYFALDGVDADLTDEEYAAVQEAMSS